MLIVSEGDPIYQRLRTIALCGTGACPLGQWRAPCNAAFRGACVDCSAPPFSSYVTPSLPIDRDTCGWQCNTVRTHPPALPGATGCSRVHRRVQGGAILCNILRIACGATRAQATGCYH